MIIFYMLKFNILYYYYYFKWDNIISLITLDKKKKKRERKWKRIYRWIGTEGGGGECMGVGDTQTPNKILKLK